MCHVKGALHSNESFADFIACDWLHTTGKIVDVNTSLNNIDGGSASYDITSDSYIYIVHLFYHSHCGYSHPYFNHRRLSVYDGVQWGG